VVLRGITYDPTFYRGSAEHYLRGRPPYSRDLVSVLTRELDLDGSGQLLDVGCGPGVLAVELAGGFDTVIGLDPDAAMLDQARRHAADNNVRNARWINARAEEIGGLGLAPMRTVSFGQSFHWTDRDVVAECVYDLLEPGGALVLVAPDIDVGTAPADPDDPPIPDGEVQEIIRRYLGPERLAGKGRREPYADRYEDALARTRFGRPRTLHAPGRRDISRDLDGVISGYLSMSYAAPHLFGDRLESFVAELRDLLERSTDTGRFSDWPGDTAVLIANKPA
jgi:SAM-dependent methyltransferase